MKKEQGKGIVNAPRVDASSNLSPRTAPSGAAAERVIVDDQTFYRIISRERKRSERSRKPFVLMLLDMGEAIPSKNKGKVLGIILSVLFQATRETDVMGWYEGHSIVGIIFTEIANGDYGASLDALIARVRSAIRSSLTTEQFNQLGFSFHVFPEDWNAADHQRPSNPKLYP